MAELDDFVTKAELPPAEGANKDILEADDGVLDFPGYKDDALDGPDAANVAEVAQEDQEVAKALEEAFGRSLPISATRR